MRGKVAFWFLLVFFVYDLEQHSRLIEQKQRRKADRLNAVWYQPGLMRRCSWQVEGAVNHGSSHEVRADESQLSANAFEGDFFLEVPFFAQSVSVVSRLLQNLANYAPSVWALQWSEVKSLNESMFCTAVHLVSFITQSPIGTQTAQTKKSSSLLPHLWWDCCYFTPIKTENRGRLFQMGFHMLYTRQSIDKS